jgi:hypothetical protein
MHCRRDVQRVHLVQWATDEGCVLGSVMVCDECMADAVEYLANVSEIQAGLSASVRAMSSKALHQYVVRRAP